MKNNSLLIKEADIKGIDELVYNPVTGKGGSIGYGYDNGQRKEGITWSGHNDHLHLGFTDRNIAIAVIDKASSMGLSTTENPYAKNDPNKKVDNVHTGGSLHYKNFPGTPLVGMAVDIGGNQTKITELINWINKTYAGQYTPATNTSSDNDDSTGGYLSSWAGNVAKTIMPVGTSIDVRNAIGLKENIDRIKSLL